MYARLHRTVASLQARDIVSHNLCPVTFDRFSPLHTTTNVNMPETVDKSNLNTASDPSVAASYDKETDLKEQVKDLAKIIDDSKFCMLTTQRPGKGLVSRCMSVAKRTGTDLLFIANKHSRKFEDLDSCKDVQVTFQNDSKNWVSIAGTAKASSDDPRIKDCYNKGVSMWFGDLGDGKHDGGPEDPRMALIEVQPTYVIYWQSKVSGIGFAKEAAQATMGKNKVADTGTLRELTEFQLKDAGSTA